jgi:hypothetical protein
MKKPTCFLCKKAIKFIAMEFVEGLAHPNCVLDATLSAKEGWGDYLTPKLEEKREA